MVNMMNKALKGILLSLICTFMPMVCIASQGYPWWLISSTSTSAIPAGYIQVQTDYESNSNVTKIVFSGGSVTNQTSTGSTTTVHFASMSVGAWEIDYDGHLTPTVTWSYDSLWETNVEDQLRPK